MNNNIEYSSVSEINRYLSYKFDSDIHLQEVYLRGEISNFKTSGRHAYFSLKDEYSEISAMFFYPSNLSLSFLPADGMKVQVVGKVQVYQKHPYVPLYRQLYKRSFLVLPVESAPLLLFLQPP